MRRELQVKRSALSDDTLKGLWCSLDGDDSNQVQADEFAQWIKLGAKDVAAQPTYGRMSGKSEMTTDSEMAGMTAVIQAASTLTMRDELEQAGVVLPSGSTLWALSERFKRWLAEYRRNKRLPAAQSHFALFKAVDTDGSGFVTYDELVRVVRKDFRVDPKDLSVSTLKALWCVLDSDDSNQLQVDEFAHWIKHGSAKGTIPAVASHVVASKPRSQTQSSSPLVPPSPPVEKVHDPRPWRTRPATFINRSTSSHRVLHLLPSTAQQSAARRQAAHQKLMRATSQSALTLTETERLCRKMDAMLVQTTSLGDSESERVWQKVDAMLNHEHRGMGLRRNEYRNLLDSQLANLRNSSSAPQPQLTNLGFAHTPFQSGNLFVDNVSRFDATMMSPSLEREATVPPPRRLPSSMSLPTLRMPRRPAQQQSSAPRARAPLGHIAYHGAIEM